MKKLPISKRFEDWRIHISRNPVADLISVWLISHKDPNNIMSANIVNGDFILTTIKEGATEGETPPLMKIPSHLFEFIADAFGRETPKKDKDITEAELRATKSHLKDMQKIVFKKYKKFELTV